MYASRTVKRACAAVIGLSTVFLAGVIVGRGPAPLPPAASSDPAPAVPPAPAPPRPAVAAAPAPLLDFGSADAEAALGAALADWFTAPGRRERALGLLVDPMAGPFDGTRPALRWVVVDARSVPGWYRPAVPGVPTVVQDCGARGPLEAGELYVWVDRFAVRSDGSVVVEFMQGNHGYAHLDVVYTVRRGPSGWQARLGEE